MVAGSGVVAQQEWSFVVVGNEHVDCSIVVEVCQGQSATGDRSAEQRAAFGSDVLQSGAVVVKEQQRLAVGHVGIDFVYEVVGVPVGYEQVEIAVVVVIKKLHAPT